jgi:hypothetical protein
LEDIDIWVNFDIENFKPIQQSLPHKKRRFRQSRGEREICSGNFAAK